MPPDEAAALRGLNRSRLHGVVRSNRARACDAKDRRDGYPVWRMFPVTEPVNEKSPCVAAMEHVAEP